MAAEDILAGISGALRGGVDQYTWQKEHKQKERAITSREDMARLKEEIRLMIEQTKEGGRNERWETPSGNVVTQEAGRTERHATPSGNIIANNEGAMNRLKKSIDFGYDKTFMEEAGRNSRWTTPSGNARLGSETTRRGQDVSASTTRRGQDIGASTARRGQDFTFELGKTRDATDRRGQDFSFQLGGERNAIAKKKGTSILDAFNEPGAPSGIEGADVHLPADVPSAPVSPLTTLPRPNTPKPAAPGGGDPLAALDVKASEALAAYRAEKDPARKLVLKGTLADLKRQRDALVSGGVGR